MKTMVNDTLTKVFKRNADESLDDWLDFYGDLQTLLYAAKSDYAIWTELIYTEQEIEIKLITQTIWLDEKQTALVFANVFELFLDEEGKKTYNAEVVVFDEDRISVVVTAKK